MIIDMHAHVGDFRVSRKDEHPPLTWNGLIARLDAEGVDMAVVLPVYNASPEGAPLGVYCGERMSVHDQVVDAARYRERVIPFGNMDPRWGDNSAGTDFGDVLDWFVEHGCRGIGEVTANVPFDDARVINMFRQIGEHGMVVTIESTNFLPGSYGLQDDPGAPRLEKLLQSVPGTKIIGHGPGFWSEIAAVTSVTDKGSYPRGSGGEGSLPHLFRTYPNLYADLSARSGFNALVRDADAGLRFLVEFQDRLMFGTDIVSAGTRKEAQQQAHIDQFIEEILTHGRVTPDAWSRLNFVGTPVPQLAYLKALLHHGQMSRTAFDKITQANAVRILSTS